MQAHVDGKLYTIQFVHSTADVTPKPGTVVKRPTTTCALYEMIHIDEARMAGCATVRLCHTDKPDEEVARRQALRKAMLAGGMQRDTRRVIWEAYRRRGKVIEEKAAARSAKEPPW